MNKVTEEMKLTMLELRKKGLTYEAIGKKLMLSGNTIQYHLNPKQRQDAIRRAMENPKQWKGRKEYNKKYQHEKYNNDPEYRKRVQKANRENWRKKHGKGNNIS